MMRLSIIHALINSSPYDEGWLIKMEFMSLLVEDLKSSEEYEELTKDET